MFLGELVLDTGYYKEPSKDPKYAEYREREKVPENTTVWDCCKCELDDYTRGAGSALSHSVYVACRSIQSLFLLSKLLHASYIQRDAGSRIRHFDGTPRVPPEIILNSTPPSLTPSPATCPSRNQPVCILPFPDRPALST